MHNTPCRGCGSETLFGAPAPDLSWYGKRKSIHAYIGFRGCLHYKEGAFDMDLIKLKAFPLTLKDKAKIWLNSLRLRTIRTWAELQAEFLKKFFSAHKTNNLKRKIYTFATHDSERFYQCWERYL